LSTARTAVVGRTCFSAPFQAAFQRRVRAVSARGGTVRDMDISTVLRRTATTVVAGLFAVVAVAAPAAASSPSAGSGAASGSDAVRPNATAAGCYYDGGRAVFDCYVTEPIVNQPWATYPGISFWAGAHVYVDAGGCVQTGGHGRTWKRYVNPSSDNGLYHGTMYLPGVTNGLQELWTLVGRTFVTTAGGALELGYEDDGYSDNGYYSHDDGTGDQCKNVGNAFVHLIIS
jgi:hypothetical protein